MKILHVLYSGLGGHGNVFFSLVSADVNNEFEYEALFNGVENVREEYKERCSHYKVKWNFIHKRPGLDFNYYLQLYKKIKQSKADHIFLHGGNAVIPAFLVRLFSGSIKTILVRETQANHLKTKMEWYRLAMALALANKIVFLSDEYAGQVKRKLNWLYKPKKIAVIPNGIDLDKFKPRKKTATGKIVLGMQSRLVKIKDHLTLLKAFAALKNEYPQKIFLLKIAGEGEYKMAITELAAQLGIVNEVELTGTLTEDELVDFIHSLDIYIHATLGETMSTAIMQVMACGIPVIASDVPGVNNMLKHNLSGLLVPVKDPQQLTNAITSLIANPAKAEELANNAYAFAAANYSNKIMLNSYNKIFNARP